MDVGRRQRERSPNDARPRGGSPALTGRPASSTSRRGRLAALLAVLLVAVSCSPSKGAAPAPDLAPDPAPDLAPAPTRAVRYLPLGDSITEGAGLPGGYRTALWQRLVERDHDRIDFVGSASGGPPGLGDRDHEGHPGWCIDGPCSGSGTDLVLPRIDGWMRRYSPDVVSVHLGTNDLVHGAGGATVAGRLDQLVGRIYAADPDVVVVLVQIIPMADQPEHDTYAALVPKVAARYRAEGRRAAVVDMSNLLTFPADYRDGLHPTQAGFDRMGEALCPAISTAYRDLR